MGNHQSRHELCGLLSCCTELERLVKLVGRFQCGKRAETANRRHSLGGVSRRSLVEPIQLMPEPDW